ncbi:MAG: hypothetical protein KGZ63_02310 [Clostridiales bacterium]|nr:hypothetical protein [Clostridiales bacterium]
MPRLKKCVTKDELQRMINERLTREQMASKLDVSLSTVARLLREFGLSKDMGRPQGSQDKEKRKVKVGRAYNALEPLYLPASPPPVRPEKLIRNECVVKFCRSIYEQHGYNLKLTEQYRNQVGLPKNLKLTNRVRRIHVLYLFQEKGGLSNTTLKQHHVVLSGFLAKAKGFKMIADNPITAVERPILDDEEAEFFTPEQLYEVLEVTKSRSIWLPVFLAACTGMRRSEVLGLGWQDVDLNTGVIRVALSKHY